LKTLVLKLTNGDLVMGDFEYEDEKNLCVSKPINIRLVPSMSNDGDIIESPVVSMYCQFSSEQYYEFKHMHVVFYKEVFPKIAEFYKKIAEDMYNIEVTRVNVKTSNVDVGQEEHKPDIDSIQETDDEAFAQFMKDIKKRLH